jgi:hypothetical protein
MTAQLKDGQRQRRTDLRKVISASPDSEGRRPSDVQIQRELATLLALFETCRAKESA